MCAKVAPDDDRRGRARGVAQLARIGLAVGDELGDGLRRNVRVNHQHEGQVAGTRDRRKVLHRIVGQALEQIGIGRMRGVGRHQQRVAVGRGARDIGRRDHAVGARLVLDDDADAERLRQMLRDQPRRGVGAAAGRKRQHQRDVAARPIVGLRGGCGSETQRGGAGGAQDAHSDDSMSDVPSFSLAGNLASLR